MLTVKYLFETLEFPSRYRGKHVLNTSKCISCGVCAKVCPNKAIEVVPITVSSGNVKLYPRIDMARCCFYALCEEFLPY